MTTICDKINTVGTILQENLNDRGVSCTFGGGSGEKNILQLVELVNDTNFRGSSDVNLKIGANRPYLLSGESTDVIVKLENGLCEPLKNKNVVVRQSVFRDGGVTGNKNTNWTNYSNRLTVTVGSDGTLLTKGSSNGYYFVNNSAFAYSDYVCEFDIVDIKGQCYWYHQASSTSAQDVINFASYNVNGKHIKIISQDGTLKVYADGNQIGSDISLTTSTPFEMGFRINTHQTDERYLKYKNFIVYDILTGVTDGKGEFALYDVSVTDDTTFTATYGTETASCLVEYCDFVDYAVTNNKNNTWYNNTGGIITVDDSGTTFTSIPHQNGTHWTCGYCPSSTTSRNPFSYPIIVEFDILHWTDSGSIWIKSDLGNRTSFNRELNHIGSRARIEIGTTSTKIYIDGTLVSTKTYTQPSTYGIEIGYYTAKSNFPTAPSLKFANLSIRPL